MPIRITRTEGGPSPETTEFELLPVEIYLRANFEDENAARLWAERAVTILQEAHLRAQRFTGSQFVVWAPARRTDGFTRSGHGYVFLSELAVRVLRALGPVRKRFELMSLSEIEPDMEMLMGTQSDRAAHGAAQTP
jgi:hypothetical protein